MKIKDLIIKVKKKKELSGLNEEFVRKIIMEIFQNEEIKSVKENSKEEKIIVKEIRKELRQYSGMFNRKLKNTEDWQSVLKSHSSTKERLENYGEIKKMIKEIHPKSILDLGCGVNPLALANKNFEYYACDIKEDELNLISSFFKKNKIKGKIFVCDLTEKNLKLPSADLCLIMKVLDLLGKNRVELTENLIKKLNCNIIIASFPTITLSGRKMQHIKRPWLERIILRNGWKFSFKQIGNEVFYIISKQ